MFPTAFTAGIPSPIPTSPNVSPSTHPLGSWLASHWPYGVGVLAAAGIVLFLIHVIGREELRQALADRRGTCETCGRPLSADEAITPHECLGEVGF